MNQSITLKQLVRQAPIIAPSMLQCDFGNLQQEIALLESAGALVLHWDVMDGHFVPNLSYGAPIIKSVRPLTSLFFDAHLMMSDPARYLDDFIAAGCDGITVHAECENDLPELIRKIRSHGIAAGIALNPSTPISQVQHILPECDSVLIMSVEPGFGGQKFIDPVLKKVTDLRNYVELGTLICIDGGINPSTIQSAAQAGANFFVAGSSVFGSPDYQLAIETLRTIATTERP